MLAACHGKTGRGHRFPFFLARSGIVFAGADAVIPPQGRAFLQARENLMDKDSKEALQVAKELTCKFIETRTVSPGNFAEVFPLIYAVVARTIHEHSDAEDKNV